MRVLKVAEQFSRTPGSRYEREGPHSGEEFRKRVLSPFVDAALSEHEQVLVDLDGTAGFGTSFLEEAFGGLVRYEGFKAIDLHRALRFKTDEEEYLETDIWTYIDEAAGAQS